MGLAGRALPAQLAARRGRIGASPRWRCCSPSLGYGVAGRRCRPGRCSWLAADRRLPELMRPKQRRCVGIGARAGRAGRRVLVASRPALAGWPPRWRCGGCPGRAGRVGCCRCFTSRQRRGPPVRAAASSGARVPPTLRRVAWVGPLLDCNSSAASRRPCPPHWCCWSSATCWQTAGARCCCTSAARPPRCRWPRGRDWGGRVPESRHGRRSAGLCPSAGADPAVFLLMCLSRCRAGAGCSSPTRRSGSPPRPAAPRNVRWLRLGGRWSTKEHRWRWPAGLAHRSRMRSATAPRRATPPRTTRPRCWPSTSACRWRSARRGCGRCRAIAGDRRMNLRAPSPSSPPAAGRLGAGGSGCWRPRFRAAGALPRADARARPGGLLPRAAVGPGACSSIASATRRFVVRMVGEWQVATAMLTEDFLSTTTASARSASGASAAGAAALERPRRRRGRQRAAKPTTRRCAGGTGCCCRQGRTWEVDVDDWDHRIDAPRAQPRAFEVGRHAGRCADRLPARPGIAGTAGRTYALRPTNSAAAALARAGGGWSARPAASASATHRARCTPQARRWRCRHAAGRNWPRPALNLTALALQADVTADPANCAAFAQLHAPMGRARAGAVLRGRWEPPQRARPRHRDGCTWR